MASSDSGHSMDYDRADAIGNSEVRIGTSLPGSTRDVDSGHVRVGAYVINASEVRDARAHETATTLEGLSSASAAARKIERFSKPSGAAMRQDASKARL